MSLLTRLSVLTRLSLLTRLRSRTTRARVAADRPVPDEQSGDPAPDAGGWRPVAGRVITVLAGLLVLVALVAPNQLDQVTLGAFVRIPAEAVVRVTHFSGRYRRTYRTRDWLNVRLCPRVCLFRRTWFLRTQR